MGGSPSAGPGRETCRRDRGESTTQVVLLVPIMLLMLLLGVQAAVWYHSANIAASAAAQGAAAASVVGAGPGTGVTVARTSVRDLGGRLAAEPIAWADGRQVAVTVRLEVPRLVPFFTPVVSRTATEPRERFIPETQR
jgi:hypothetical protein